MHHQFILQFMRRCVMHRERMMKEGNYVPMSVHDNTNYVRMRVWLDEYGWMASRNAVMLAFSTWCDVIKICMLEFFSDNMMMKYNSIITICLNNSDDWRRLNKNIL